MTGSFLPPGPASKNVAVVADTSLPALFAPTRGQSGQFSAAAKAFRQEGQNAGSCGG